MKTIHHFMDSGAFSLLVKAEQYAKENNGDKSGFYQTAEFKQYLDAYAVFVEKYRDGIDLYANVDVIGNPELTFANHCYLVGKGLSPVPVFHQGSDLQWLQKYLDRGEKIIGLGGLVGSGKTEFRAWLDKVFRFVCPKPKHLPIVKLHGFGVTGWGSLTRYPWWSVDSTAWTKYSYFGLIIVPKKHKGKFVFDKPFEQVRISVADKADIGRIKAEHYIHWGKRRQEDVIGWLEHIDIPLGKMAADRTVIEKGVMTSREMRCKANLIYFNHLRDSLPTYPWTFGGLPKGGLLEDA